MDVKTDVGVGGFSSSLPVVVGSMGSTDTASKTTLAIARGAAAQRDTISLLIGGRLYDGGHVVKSLALGVSSTYTARPFLIAALARGEKGVENYIESLKVEIQMFTSVLGKYDVKEIS
jgi:isopentenyl diphosphate isomerase/L-lactate dehydrogenase-like FMN-dependent dehydrogenase